MSDRIQIRTFRNIVSSAASAILTWCTTKDGDATRTEKARLDNNGLFTAKAFGINGGSAGADFSNGKATSLTVEKGIVTAVANDAWVTSFVPVVTAESGSLTAYTAASHYLVVGKICFITIDITITTNGTGGGSIHATLPFSSIAVWIFNGREQAAVGTQLQGLANGSTVAIYNYDNTYPAADGYRLFMSGFFEIA